jgi:hypothetical protein
MASGLFALLDDIAVLMDDVAVMSKLAAKKTAGILGDDLAVNAEKASGFVSDRELHHPTDCLSFKCFFACSGNRDIGDRRLVPGL